MKIFEKTYSTPEENLACEEAILLNLEERGRDEVMRIWYPAQTDAFPCFVVLGHANKVKSEVKVDACQKYGVPILRRCSGGGTVLNGHGCLNYSLYLRMDLHPELETIESTNQYVLGGIKVIFDAALQGMNNILFPNRKIISTDFSTVKIQGTSDLTWCNIKFSGNAQNRKKRYVLFHGTILHSFDRAWMDKILKSPPKQPEYRKKRKHRDFVNNFPIPKTWFIENMKRVWNVEGTYKREPTQLIQELVETKYSQDSWNFKF